MNSGKIFSAVCFLLLTLTVSAAPSPWDSWRSGYTNFEQGEALRERGSYTEALSFFEKARKNYQAVRSARPDWNQRVIADRLRDCDRQISELKRLLGEGTVKSSPPSAVKPNVPQRVEKSSGSSATAHSPSESAGDDVVVVKAREISELRKEVVRLKAEKEQLGKEIQRQRNFETEVAALLRDRKIMEDKYALLDKRYKALEAERKRPDEKIISLEQRLVDEKMNSERLSKQIVALEQQSRIEKENSRMNLAARNALESLLQKRSEDLRIWVLLGCLV